MIELKAARECLADVVVPGLQRPVSDFLSDLQCSADSIVLSLSIPVVELAALEDACFDALQPHCASLIGVDIQFEAPAAPVQASLDALSGVRNTIVVASGKGGVGKSTTSVNLALALSELGAKVGLLDADIYGPSIQLMMGVADGVRPQQQEGKYFVPVQAHGLQTMSMAYLVTEKTPMVWRGPMASGALQQILKQTLWQDLDYLVIDMPPGTGDIQLTLSQSLPVSGAVVVTTPQTVALLDAQKGIEMFKKVSVPLFGVIENMSFHQCSACGHEEAIFGSGAGELIEKEYGVGLMAQLPLQSLIREKADQGDPIVVSEPESQAASIYKSAALRLAAAVSDAAIATPAAPIFEVSDE